MFDILERLSSTLIVRYRRVLIVLACVLLGLHALAFVMGLVPPTVLGLESGGEQAQWLGHLVSYSQSLLGFTGALLLLYLLSDTVRSIRMADEQRKKRVHAFIRERLEGWFGDGGASDAEAFVDAVVDDATFSHFKVEGHPPLLDDAPLAAELCSEVHFELTFYPTKLIYGLHFESPVASVNRELADRLRDELGLGDGSGFEVDRVVPKRPEWIFLIRTVPLSGNFEADFPEVMTHARHFVELVGHMYRLVYARPTLERYRSVLDEAAPAASSVASSQVG